MNRRTLILLATLVPVLAGCVGAAVVGVGAGALMFTDRRQNDTILIDEGIEIRVANRIGEKFKDNVNVSVTSYNRTVLLTGQVPNEAVKSEIESIAAGVANVKRLQNELVIGPVISLTARAKDAYITSNVKARFIDSQQFSANQVKVVTENSQVYLLGLVTQREADAAVQVARTSAEVKKVVRIFEIISEAEAKRADPPPAQPAKLPDGTTP
jgi:osmotically-inducible protein OsmY